MADLTGYNAEDHEPLGDFEALPKGNYPGMAIESGMKPTKAGTGRYLQFVWQVVDGEFKGRQLWSRLNLENPNKVAVEIAQRELSSICRAVGVMRPKNSEEIHGKPIMLKVVVGKNKDTGELTNEVKGYEALNGGAASAASSDAKQPPWKR